MPVRIVAIVALTVAYLALSQWLMASPESPWNAALLLSPMLAVVAVGAWRSGQRVRALLAALAVAALFLQAPLGWAVPPPLLYLAQQIGIHATLGWWFASSLRDPRGALITRLAAQVHRVMTPAKIAYTRNVTRAWVGYFVAMIVASIAIYAWAGFEAWTWYANVANPIALVLMFAGERLLRYRLHPEFERSSVADALRAYQRALATEPPPPGPRA